MATGIVKCRICKQPINKKVEQEGIDWIMPSKGWYYHVECYNTWKGKSTADTVASDKEWEEYIFDFLKRDLRMDYNYMRCKGMIDKYLKNGMTMKGIFLSLKYFYEVQKGDKEKANGGIGIVPHVYEDAKQYWITQIIKKQDILSIIEKQMKDRTQKDKIKITKKNKKKEWQSQLNAIGETEDE